MVSVCMFLISSSNSPGRHFCTQALFFLGCPFKPPLYSQLPCFPIPNQGTNSNTNSFTLHGKMSRGGRGHSGSTTGSVKVPQLLPSPCRDTNTSVTQLSVSTACHQLTKTHQDSAHWDHNSPCCCLISRQLSSLEFTLLQANKEQIV